jgi:biotin carboxylase
MKQSILVFGVSDLQKSLIQRCKAKYLFTVGIDPDPAASCRQLVDAFEVVGGQDVEGTLAVVEKYDVSAIITAATDKPLVIMARVAEAKKLPFFSVVTAECSTDKYLMKQRFQLHDIPCAKGFLLNSIDELSSLTVAYPVIVKPRDNSGSRGVIYCSDEKGLKNAVAESLTHTKKGNVLVEEYIDGKEYSVEGIHYRGKTHVIQITEKITSQFPYNVEMGHLQPADLTEDQKREIQELVSKVATALKFDNCASHTELKINPKGITIIETSPRLGGDFISSTLVPLSTGVSMEDILIYIATETSLTPGYNAPVFHKCSGIIYFELPEGTIADTEALNDLNRINGLYDFTFDLKPGNVVKKIRSSIDRYGYVIFSAANKSNCLYAISRYKEIINSITNVTFKL